MTEKNVAELIGKKFQALAIQCSVKTRPFAEELGPAKGPGVRIEDKKILHCSGTTNPTPEYFDVKWEIEVDELIGRHVTQMAYNQFIEMATIYPVGGAKTCMARLGSGRGSVELICSEDERDLVHFVTNPGFREELRKRGLLGDIPEER